MARAAAIQSSFFFGELSPLAKGRVESDEYKQALGLCLGYIPTAQGGVTAMPGTKDVNAVKDENAQTLLVRFEFSTVQAYILEFGNLYVRFYKNEARIENPPGTPVEVATPYTTAQLSALQFTQSADVLYIAHQAHHPRKLVRVTDLTWVLSELGEVTGLGYAGPIDGPYLNINSTLTTITPSATAAGAPVTLTASAATFASTDVGRLVRLLHGAVWGFAVITAFSSTTVVTGTIIKAFGATTATTFWRLGLWSVTTGYPSSVAFYEDRLFFGGVTNFPQRIDGSRTGIYHDFSPTQVDGTVVDSDAVSFTLGSRDVNAVRWLLDDERALVAGTPGGPWIIRPSNTGQAMTPTNISAKRLKSYGCSAVQAAHIGDSVAYMQRDGRKLRAIEYGSTAIDSFAAPDYTFLSEHITRGGIAQMAVQLSPQPILWAVRGDGVLLGMTFAPGADGRIAAGWSRHIRGGSFAGGAAVVESIAVIPAPDGTRDQIWMSVKRTINGATSRRVEFVTKMYDGGDAVADAVFVDSAVTYTGAATSTITGLGHLNGETVSILADGSTHPDRVVSGGSITLDRATTKCHVGLAFSAQCGTLRNDIGAQNGTAQGKVQRINRVIFRLHETGALETGPELTQLEEMIFRTSETPTNAAVPLFTGDREVDFSGDYSTEALIYWTRHQPLPSTVLAIFPQLETQDRG